MYVCVCICVSMCVKYYTQVKIWREFAKKVQSTQKIDN